MIILFSTLFSSDSKTILTGTVLLYNKTQIEQQAISKPNIFSMFSRDGIFKLSGSQESITPVYVAWRAGATTLFILGSQPP